MSYGGMDEVQRLVLQVQGEAALKTLNAELEQTRAQMAKYIESHKQGVISSTQYEASMRSQARVMVDVKNQIADLSKSVGSKTTPNSLGYALTQASYAVDDFAAGFSNRGLAGAMAAVQNNIPGLIASLGAGAGLAGGIGIAGVALATLAQNWDTLAQLWGKGGTEAETARMNKLKEAAESAAEAIRHQIDALEKARMADSEASAIATAAIDEQGGARATAAGVQKQMIGESLTLPAMRQQAADYESKVQAAEAYRAGGGTLSPQERARLAINKQKADETRAALEAEENATRVRAQETVVKASQGDAGAIAELARRFPGGSFGQATPEARRAQQAEVEAADAQGEALKRGGVKRRAAAGLVDALTGEGRVGEQAMQAQAKAARDDDFKQLKEGLEMKNAAPQVATSREVKSQMFKLEQQAASLTGQMMMDQMNGFGVEGIQQQINAMEQQYNMLRMQLRKQMGGQMGGAQDTALPMHMPGGGGMGG